MARRSGQVGYEEVKRGWYHVRFRMDVPGQEKRAYLSKPICPISGPGSLTKPERLKLRKEIITASGADTEKHFNKVEAFNHGLTFRKQAEWWLNHVQTRKRKPIKPATALGFTSYLNKWLYPNLGDLPLSLVNNLVVRSLVTTMTKARLSPKMVSNVIQVVKMVVASAVNENGEEIHPRTWNHEFIDLPEVKEQRQPVHSSETMKAIAAGSEGREQMLYVLLGATGIRFGEAFGLEIDKHISNDFSTLYIRQKVWSGHVQPFLKTEQRGSGHRSPFIYLCDAQEVHRGTNFGVPVSVEERIPATTVERLEAFLASASQTTRATEVGCSRISAVPRDVAEEAARARRPDSFLARPRKQERHRSTTAS